MTQIKHSDAPQSRLNHHFETPLRRILPLSNLEPEMSMTRLSTTSVQPAREITLRSRRDNKQLLFKAYADLSWAFYNLHRRRHRDFVKRRRILVLRAVGIARRHIVARNTHAAIECFDHFLAFLPNAVLLHAARTCALLISERSESQELLRGPAGQRFCGVRWENIVFQQLDQLRKVPGVLRIMSEVGMLLDCMEPSPGELERIRLQLPELAGTDFWTSVPPDRGAAIALALAVQIRSINKLTFDP